MPANGLIPVTILTGFLGSGKTTLLNNILSDKTHGMKFAVIENEFGEVGVDEKILREDIEEELVEVMNGCICCTVRGDLVVALKKMYQRVEQFDGIIIETTGWYYIFNLIILYAFLLLLRFYSIVSNIKKTTTTSIIITTTRSC